VRKFILTLIVVALAPAAPAGPLTVEDKELKDETLLQGSWQAVSRIDDGEITPKDGLAHERWTFKGNKLTITKIPRSERNLLTIENSFRVYPLQKIKVMKCWTLPPFERIRVPTIYSLDGDFLRVCYSREKDEPPSEFSAHAGSNLVLVMLKRVKETK
jgi:uncharacterized protein (TIGR03067 family)